MSDSATAPDLPPARSKLVPALLAANLLMTGGVGTYFLSRGAPAAAEAPAQAAEAGAGAAQAGLGPTVRLADFVVQLRSSEGERYARMSFELEVKAEPDKERINRSLAKIRELILSYLSDRVVEELRGSEGIERAKRELLAKLTAEVPSAPVHAIYITDVVIQ